MTAAIRENILPKSDFFEVHYFAQRSVLKERNKSALIKFNINESEYKLDEKFDK